MKVSVVIPTYRDWPRLALCLAALRAQTLPAGEFEIIVADNDALPLPLDQRPAGVRYVHAPQGYSYAARNAGAALAGAPVLAFTDADCLPTPQWLQAGLAALTAHPDCDLMAGRIDISAAQDNAAVRYERLFEFQQESLVQLGGYSVTANLFVRAAAFQAVGGFDAGLKSCGDSEFCLRAGRSGHAIGYADAALLHHPARDSLHEILAKNRRIATGEHARIRREAQGSAVAVWRGLLYAFRPRPREWFYLLRGGRGSEAYPLPQRAGVLAVRLLVHYQMAWCMLRSQLSHGRSDAAVR